MTPTKEFPHDLLAEKALIGCLILDGSSFDEIADLGISKDDFYQPQYGHIYDGIKELVMDNQAVEYVSVCSKLNERGMLESVGGNEGILNIVEEQVSVANVYHYAKTVKDKAGMREIVRTAMRVADMGLNFSGKAEDYVQEVEASFFKLTNDAKSGGMVDIKSALKENLKALEDTSRGKGEIGGLSTGFKKLDKRLLGMNPGQLFVLAARPGMGKTALALNIAVNACETSGKPVAIFSLEMVANELSARILCSKAKVDSKRMKTKDFLDSDMRNIGQAVKDLSQLPIFMSDAGEVSLLDIQSHCRKIQSQHGLGLVVIDYLQLMKSHTGNPSREQQISEMSRGLKGMAKEMGCPVMVLSQLNRGVETRPNKRPTMSDLRESGAIEQDADAILFIYRDEYYNPDSKDKGIAEVIVGKNRAGEPGTEKLTWMGPYFLFGNLAYDGPIDTGE